MGTRSASTSQLQPVTLKIYIYHFSGRIELFPMKQKKKTLFQRTLTPKISVCHRRTWFDYSNQSIDMNFRFECLITM